jgi:hypothetical protein
MPNHVINELVFNCSAEGRLNVWKAACNQERQVDFSILVPIPVNIWRGSVGKVHQEAFGQGMNALDWSRKNWGTKWNAYGHSAPKVDGDTLTLRFQTAWGPPYPWLVALFNTCGGFQHNWLDEGREGGRTGIWNLADKYGESWVELDADQVMNAHLRRLLCGEQSGGDL